MKRLILLSTAPGLAPGRWDIELINPVAVGDLISDSHASRILISLITFETTLDVLAALAGVNLQRFDTTHSTQHKSFKPTRIMPAPGDVLLSVLLNDRGKRKTRGSVLDSTDLDFYKIEIS